MSSEKTKEVEIVVAKVAVPSPPEPEPPAPPRAEPTQLLHYRLLDKLGEGGMGAVYRAEDQRLGRSVAIKRVGQGASEQGRQRLMAEARAASALSHPHIVTVFAIEESAGDVFLVMEHVHGETLAARIAAGPLDVGLVLQVGAEVADALACAHAAGLVHRDIKPENVMLTARGAKVLDFGLAKASGARAEGASTLTGAGIVVGTLPYMSPEQLRGAPLDGRSDLFALGGVLYEAATGKRAFPAPDVATLIHQITSVEPVPPRAIARALPAALEAIVLRALAKEPAQRYASADEMAADLRAAARGLTASATVASPLVPASPRSSSIAVLPFLDLSAAHDQDYLCEGIAEEIMTALTHVVGLRVAARSSAFQLKASGADARAAGERLGVDVVLEGSVRKAGERLRVTVQLVDVSQGHQRWSHRFDGSLADVFAIQDEIAASVATQLRGVLTASAQHALYRPQTTPEAYEHFLRGRQLLRQQDDAFLTQARRALERAIELDASYAPAHAALAMLHAFRADWCGGGAEAQAAADRESDRALALGPQLEEAQLARAAVLAMRRDYPAAERAYQEALRLNPQSFDAHYHYARLCTQMGQPARAAELFQRGGELQIEDFQCPILGFLALRRLGRHEEAQQALREGVRRVERMLELDPDNSRALSLGACALVDAGQPERALEWCGRVAKVAPHDVAANYNAACLYAKLGKDEEALGCLERTFGRGIGKRDWVEHDSDWDRLRGDPRFQALLAKLPP